MATQTITLSADWQSLGAGPLVVTLEAGETAQIHIASSLPAATAAYHTLFREGPPNDRSFWDYTGAENVYARKDGSPGNKVVKLSYTT